MFVFLSAASPWMCPGTVSTNSNTAGLLGEIHLASLGMPKWLWRCNSLILGGEHCSSYCYGKSMWLSWRAASAGISLFLSLSLWRRRRRWSGGGGGGAWLRFVQAAVPHQGEKNKKSSALFTLYHPVRNAGQRLCVSGASASLVGTLELRTTRSELEGHIAAKWLMSHLYWPANLRSTD